MTLEELHSEFCQASGRPEPFRFSKVLWMGLLGDEEYRGDVEALRRDVGFVTWYLRKAISDGKRQPGSLRPRNLLVPAQFSADLAEAVQMHPQAFRRHCAKKVAPAISMCRPETAADDAEERLRKESAAGLRALREQFGFPSQEETSKLKSAKAIPPALPEAPE